MPPEPINTAQIKDQFNFGPAFYVLTTCHTIKQVKQNATNNLAPFFRSAFNALSDGVLRFAHCVAP